MIFDSFEIESLLLIREINNNISRALTTIFGAYNITWNQACVLLALSEEDGRTISELCSLLRTQKSNLSPLCKRLEAGGFVTRVRQESDQRLVRIYLTDQTREILDHCVDCNSIGAQRHLTPQQQQMVLEGLRQICTLTSAPPAPQKAETTAATP